MMTKRFIRSISIAPWLLALGCIGLLYLLKPILTPFIAASILAYILQPLVHYLTQQGWHRTMATCIVIIGVLLLTLALLLIIVPLLLQQFSALFNYVPRAIEWLREHINFWLARTFNSEISFNREQLSLWLFTHSDEAAQAVHFLLPSLTQQGMAFFQWLLNLALIPMVLFYLLRDWPKLKARITELIPRRWLSTVTPLGEEVDAVLGQFLRGQLAVMFIITAFYSLSLALLKVEAALVIGVITGSLIFVPYFGFAIGLGCATLAAILQFGTVSALLPVWTVFAVGQIIEGFWITPTLVGERIGLHSLAVIFVLLAFGQLFGFIGVLLALPLAAVALVALRHLRTYYWQSRLYRQG